MKPTVYCIIGRTGSGKDSLSKGLNKPIVVSYTTRPKRATETNGVEHWFISKEEMEEKKTNKDNIIAWTRIGEYEYCATIDCITDGCIYIIDPNGLEYLKDNFSDMFNIVVVYVWCDFEVRVKRCCGRSDFNKEWDIRNNKEDIQFKKFESNRNWDILIDNSNSFENGLSQLRKGIKNYETNR